MGDTALVLGGGGPVGGAWLTGVLAGLAEAGARTGAGTGTGTDRGLDRDLDPGLDPGAADVVIGTSAGAVFGSLLLSGVPAAELYGRQLGGADAIRLPVTLGQTARYLWAALGSRDPQRSVERLGRAALRARTGAEQEVFSTVGSLLGDVRDWPERELRIAAVDARTGETETFDARSGVTLLEAVAASCAVPVVWPPVTVAGRRWIDGGSRSTANLQLARGYRRVIAVAPIPQAVGPHPSAQQQAEELSAAGAEVLLVTPDRAARRAMGRNLADDTRRPAAARAGYAQATALAASVAEFQRG